MFAGTKGPRIEDRRSRIEDRSDIFYLHPFTRSPCHLVTLSRLHVCPASCYTRHLRIIRLDQRSEGATMSTDVTLSRHLPWDACYNIRDVGGYTTADGGQIRWRALVRADNLCRLTPAGRAALVDYGVRTI